MSFNRSLCRALRFRLAVGAALLLPPIAAGVALGNNPGEKQSRAGGAAAGAHAGDSQDKKMAADVIDRLAMAWNQDDAESVAALFAPDAVLVMPTGSVARSRPQIKGGSWTNDRED